METKLSFSERILKDDILYATSLTKSVYFSICREIVAHPDHGTIIELRIEKCIYDHASLR